MERIIDWHLKENHDKFGKISVMQHAYSSNKGTKTALSTLVDRIESAIYRDSYALVISVDIKGAFDNLSTESIEKAMEDNEYPPLMREWYSNFLRNRLVTAEILGEKITVQPTCGTPQGGVLSPRVWNITFDPLLRNIKNDGGPCVPIAFADDIALILEGKDPKMLVQLAQPYINKAVEWGGNNGLSFSTDKTTVGFFNKKTSLT